MSCTTKTIGWTVTLVGVPLLLLGCQFALSEQGEGKIQLQLAANR